MIKFVESVVARDWGQGGNEELLINRIIPVILPQVKVGG